MTGGENATGWQRRTAAVGFILRTVSETLGQSISLR